jgi:hypothetical protein
LAFSGATWSKISFRCASLAWSLCRSQARDTGSFSRPPSASSGHEDAPGKAVAGIAQRVLELQRRGIAQAERPALVRLEPGDVGLGDRVDGWGGQLALEIADHVGLRR